MKKDKLDMNHRDIESLIIADVIDLTDGAFDVTFESDDCGTHIQIAVEKHEDAGTIVTHFSINAFGYNILVLKVPEGYLDD